jgi:hypothetical protein
LKEKNQPKSSFKTLISWLVKIGVFILILYICGFIALHIFFLGGQYFAFEDAKREVFSWDLPPHTELIDLRIQRVNRGTFCIAGIDMIIDSNLSQGSIREFYFETSSNQYHRGYITEVENQQNDIVRYTLHFEMNPYSFWGCA